MKSTFDVGMTILDVGAGSGQYGRNLNDKFKINALEIYEPYVEQFNLKSIYDNVIIGDIRNFSTKGYDYVIMGDIIEHLTHEEATEVLNSIKCKYMFAVPYKMKQGEVNGNIYETHKQDDLTNEIVLSRYPRVICLFHNSQYGYYINY
jgi:2-polyprenyl-3-methyl-5-hydroxy-6-metoxy-1,4-benzoquinol methylase